MSARRHLVPALLIACLLSAWATQPPLSSHKIDAPLDTETLFRIASISKAFTTASLAMFADEGKPDWSDRDLSDLDLQRVRDE